MLLEALWNKAREGYRPQYAESVKCTVCVLMCLCVCLVERKTEHCSYVFQVKGKYCHCHLCIAFIVWTPEYNHLLYVYNHDDQFKQFHTQWNACQSHSNEQCSSKTNTCALSAFRITLLWKAVVRLWLKALLKEQLLKWNWQTPAFRSHMQIETKGQKTFLMALRPITNLGLLLELYHACAHLLRGECKIKKATGLAIN